MAGGEGKWLLYDTRAEDANVPAGVNAGSGLSFYDYNRLDGIRGIVHGPSLLQLQDPAFNWSSVKNLPSTAEYSNPETPYSDKPILNLRLSTAVDEGNWADFHGKLGWVQIGLAYSSMPEDHYLLTYDVVANAPTPSPAPTPTPGPAPTPPSPPLPPSTADGWQSDRGPQNSGFFSGNVTDFATAAITFPL